MRPKTILATATLFVLAGTAAQGQDIPASTSGVVYLRSDTIAYPANYVPVSGLPNAQISLAVSSTTTDTAGQFSIPSSTTPANSYVPLIASLPGFMRTWYPWLPVEAKQPLPLALYPEVAATTRPRFVKGIVPHDMGGWLPGVYAAGLFPTTFDRIKNVVGGNMVVFVDPAWVTAYDVETNSVTMGTGPLNMNFGMASRSMYETIVGQAKDRGLQFMMMLGIEGDSSLGNNFVTVPATNSAFWDAWFAAYRPLVLDRTIIARDLGIEYVSLGYSLAFMWALGPSRWQSLIEAMRAVGYTGKIVNFVSASMQYGNFPYAQETFPDGSRDRASFMGLFDAIGINFYDGVTKAAPDEVLSAEQTRARIRTSLKSVLDNMSVSPVPILMMIGTPSVHGGVSNSDYIEPCLPCNSLAPFKVRDYQQQADLYQAASEVINDSPIGNGRVMGLLSWGYAFRDDFSYGDSPGDSAYDKSANIRGKPAEAVLRSWFDRWSAPVTLALTPGWNLVGNGYSGTINAVTEMGDTTKVITVWKWMSATGKWAFYTPSMNNTELTSYAASKNYDVLTTLNGGEGFWVNAKVAFTAQLPTGTAISSTSFQNMASGWNLIAVGDNQTPSSFNVLLSVTPPSTGVIPTNVTTLWAWDALQGNWYFYAASLEAKGGTALTDYITSKGYLDFTTNNKTLGPGVGFWVNKP